MRKYLVSILFLYAMNCSTAESARKISASGDPEDIFFEKEQQTEEVYADSKSKKPAADSKSKREIMSSIDEDLAVNEEDELKESIADELSAGKKEAAKQFKDTKHYDKKQSAVEKIAEYKSVSGADFDQVGFASWYGPRFQGKKTASGETFDKNKLTAAHPTLPLGTEVKIHNFDNNKEVVVRINDRGPYSGNRIIDVSEKAAEMLNFVHAGTAKVGIKVVKPGDEDIELADENKILDDEEAELITAVHGKKTAMPGTHDNYYIQLGVFNEKERAQTLMEEIVSEYGQQSVIENRNGQYVIKMGNFSNRQEAEELRDRMKEKGIDCFIPKK